MRVLQIIDSLRIGGAQKLLVTFGQEARARGVETTVITLNDDVTAQPVARELEGLGVRVQIFPGRGLLDPARIFRLTGFVRSGGFDVIQTHLTYANILGALAGRLAGVPVINTLHSVGQDSRHQNALRDGMENWVMRHLAARVVAVGYKIAEVHQPRLKRFDVEVIPNAVPVPTLPSMVERMKVRGELTGDASRMLIISVGRLSPPKGFSDLLRAFALVQPAYPHTTLMIVGDGVLCADLAEETRELGLEGSVLLPGARDDVGRLLAASDLYVSSSHWEGLPLGVLEAMMAGLPVACTDVGDLPQVVVQNETGLIVPAHQPEQLAAVMRRLMEDAPLRVRMGKAARLRAQQVYSPEVWFDRMLALFAEVTGRQPEPVQAVR